MESGSVCRLGLGGGLDRILDTEDLVDDADLAQPQPAQAARQTQQVKAEQLLQQSSQAGECRELLSWSGHRMPPAIAVCLPAAQVAPSSLC